MSYGDDAVYSQGRGETGRSGGLSGALGRAADDVTGRRDNDSSLTGDSFGRRGEGDSFGLEGQSQGRSQGLGRDSQGLGLGRDDGLTGRGGRDEFSGNDFSSDRAGGQGSLGSTGDNFGSSTQDDFSSGATGRRGNIGDEFGSASGNARRDDASAANVGRDIMSGHQGGVRRGGDDFSGSQGDFGSQGNVSDRAGGFSEGRRDGISGSSDNDFARGGGLGSAGAGQGTDFSGQPDSTGYAGTVDEGGASVGDKIKGGMQKLMGKAKNDQQLYDQGQQRQQGNAADNY